MKAASKVLSKLIHITLIFIFITSTATAQKSGKDKTDSNTQWVKQKAEARHYTCEIKTATPSGGRMKHLSPGYILKVSGDSLISNLPYFGQAYNSAGVSGSGYVFTSTSFDYSSDPRKKGGWEIRIKTKDQPENAEFFLTIFESGSISISVNSMSRSSISYSGNLNEN
ncbi:MAG: DUF4251 domain-containing protein [Chitinophagaceae bacterium]|nr:DUF4251 domain-containing protein [Chitinophagaceae bacterium]